MANNAQNYYLPSVRRGLFTKTAIDSSNLQRRTVSVSVTANSSAGNEVEAKVNIAVVGPGDVLGFREDMILRTDPQPNIGNFNPSHIPFIEFAEPDFLWRYSTIKDEVAGVKKYWQPWLTLIVLKSKEGEEVGEFEIQKRSNPERPSTIKLSSEAILPDLNAAWRWAHVHVNDQAGRDMDYIQAKIIGTPRSAVGRLMCPRRLDVNTKYTAFVIPTFRLGVEAGLGRDLNNNDAKLDQLAWNEPDQARGKVIPFYYHWEFRTGLRGDFEYLIKQLEFKKLPGIGTRMVDCSNPGYGLKNDAHKAIEFEGALCSLDKDYQDWGFDAEQSHPSKEFQYKLAEVLNSSIENPGQSNEIRRVVPPTYGKWYAEDNQNSTEKYELTKDQRNWINELNLDFRHRFAAGLGVEFIKDNQEKLMKAAWQQLREIKKANKALNVKKFGRAVSSCMHKRLANLDMDRLFQLTMPVHSKVFSGPAEENNARVSRNYSAPSPVTVSSEMRNSSIVTLAAQSKLRKYTGRKFDIHSLKGQQERLQNHRIQFIPILEEEIRNKKRELGAKEELTARINTLSKLVCDKIAPKETIEKPMCKRVAGLRNKEEIHEKTISLQTLQVKKKDELRPILWYPEFHTPMYRYLRDKSQDLIMPGLDNIPPNTITILKSNQRFIESFLLGLNHEFAAELRWREYPTDMRGSYFRKFWDTTIYSLDDSEKEKFKQHPSRATLVVNLKRQHPRLTGEIEKIEDIFDKPSADLTPDLIAIAKAYEEAVEKWLLTREEDKDITKIDNWAKHTELASHAKEGSGNDQIVLLIRGDILNTFPNVEVYLAEKVNKETPNYQKRHFPIFEGNLPPDIILLGFDISTHDGEKYFLVFEEPVSALHYGLDESDEKQDDAKSSDTSWQHFNLLEGEYLNNTVPTNITDKTWNSPAKAAEVFTQKSIRVAIPLSRFI